MSEYENTEGLIRDLYALSKRVRSKVSQDTIADAIEMIEDLAVRLDDALQEIDRMERGIAR